MLGMTAEAFGDPITITLDRRTASAAVQSGSPVNTGGNDALVTTAAPPVGQGAGLSSAELTSSFANSMHWFGTGDATVTREAGTGFYFASSNFTVDFIVTSPVSYTFEGTLSGSRTVPFGCCNSDNVSAILWPDTGRDRDNEVNGPELWAFNNTQSQVGSSAVTRSFAGVLAPGPYVFTASAHVWNIAEGPGTANNAFQFAFNFAPAAAPTPEPASLLLLGTGLGGLFVRRARHTNQD